MSHIDQEHKFFEEIIGDFSLHKLIFVLL